VSYLKLVKLEQWLQTFWDINGCLDICFTACYLIGFTLIFTCNVSVRCVDCSMLVCGWPYGGCAILYQQSLFSSITPLLCDSNRFCAVKLHDSCGFSVLVVCVNMPAQSHSFCFDEYFGTIGELEGFLECDVNLLVGNFNVDFPRDGN